MTAWDEFAAALETVVEHGVRLAGGPGEITGARAAFYARTGTPVAEHPGFDRRNAAFLEWFVFERPLDATGTLPVVRVEREDHDESVRDWAARIRNGGVVVGTIAKIRGDHIAVEPWAGPKKISLAVGSSIGFERHAVIVGRLFELDDTVYLSPSAEIIDGEIGRALRRAVVAQKTRYPAEAIWYAALRFLLFVLHYPKARPDELVGRWLQTAQVA